PDGQLRRPSGAQVLEDVLQPPGAGEELRRLLRHPDPDRRRLDPPTTALVERQPEGVLQRDDVLAHGRRGVPEVGRRTADGTARDDGPPDGQAVEIDHGFTIWQCLMFIRKRTLVPMSGSAD